MFLPSHCRPFELHKVFVALIVVVASLSVTSHCGAAGPTLRVGTGLTDITPEQLPVSMTGGFTDRKATQVHDRLHARCLVLDDGVKKVALLVCDCCLAPRDVFDSAKRLAAERTDIRADHMLMSATHTHTAVTIVDLAQCHADPKYNEFLIERLAQAVVQAHEQLQPASIGWGVAQLPDEVSNRRWHVQPGTIPADPFGRTSDRVRTNPPAGSTDLIEPAGPTDPNVTVLVVQDAQGGPLAVYANYALHYVGGIPRDSLSADYFGEFGRLIGARKTADLAKPCLGLLSNAASGDVNNLKFDHKSAAQAPFEQVRRVASRVVEAAERAEARMKFSAQVTLAVAERDVPVRVRKPNQNEINRALARLAVVEDSQSSVVPRVYAQESLELAKYPEQVPVKLQVIRIGEMAIVAIPGEPFCQIGLDIKQASPFRPTMIVSLANGYHGYIPTPEQHALGGYETWPSRWSYLEVDASRQLTAVATELLQAVSSTKP